MNEHLIKLNLCNKLGTCRLIVNACKHNAAIFNHNPDNKEELVELLEKLTFLNEKTIEAYIHSITPKLSFTECLSKPAEEVGTIPYESIRNVIYKLYVKDQVVPTRTNIRKHFLSSTTEYSEESLNLDLRANKFILKQLFPTQSALITEEPKQIYNRMKYLNKVRNFRHLKRNFIYVINRDESYCLAISPHSGVLSFQSYKNSTDDKATRLFKFINGLIPFIPEYSVVVLDSQQLLDSKSLPNQYSSKQQMQEWLIKHDLMYAPDAHTAELYCIIQKMSKKYVDTCDIGDMLKRHGLDLLLVPREMQSLSYYNPILQQIGHLKHMSQAQYLNSIFRKYGNVKLVSMEDTLKTEEIRIYSEDLELEKIIDTIRVVATRTAILPKSLVSCVLNKKEIICNYIILD